MLIDEMDDATNRAYGAVPDRLFLIDAEGAPARLSETPWQTGVAPLLGQHTDEIVSALLDLAAAAIEELREAGVVA